MVDFSEMLESKTITIEYRYFISNATNAATLWF